MIKHLRKQIYKHKEISHDDVKVMFSQVDEHLYAIIWYGLHQTNGHKIIIKWIGKWLGGYYNKAILTVPKNETNLIDIGFKEALRFEDIKNMLGIIELLRDKNKIDVFKILKNKLKIQRWFINNIVLEYMENVKNKDILNIMQDHYIKYNNIKDIIQKAYTRIVYSEASRISKKNIEHFKENFQNGCIGLDKSFLRYNQYNNVTYGNYAYYWVRQAIMYIMKETSGSIKLPSSVWEIFYKIEKLKENKPSISVKEIAEVLGFTPKRIKEILKHIDNSRTMSLNFMVGENTQLYEILINNETKDMDTSFLNNLKPWHQKLLILTYGLYDLLDQ